MVTRPMLQLEQPLSAGLQLTDLLLSLDEVGARLTAAAAACEWLDAFLLAAAAVQIVEDHLQPETLARRAAGVLGGPVGWAARRTADGGERLRRVRERACLAWLRGAEALRDDLADAVMTEGAPAAGIEDAAEQVASGVAGLPRAARAAVLRLPSAFRAFDLAPADAATLARGLRERVGAAPGAVVVVGVRTSGSYLGPLVAATLRAEGWAARAVTARPGRSLLPPARQVVRHALSRPGPVVAVVDDPPGTGSAFRKTCSVLRAAGVPASATTLLMPLFGDVAPAALDGMAAVTLPFGNWVVHARLEPVAVAQVLERYWHRPVDEIRRRPADTAATGRGHVTATYDVASGGERRAVEVRGVGQGLFGRHSLAVAAALGPALPTVHGFDAGLVYGEAPVAAEARPVTGPQDAQARARYVVTRAAALPALGDRTRDMAGRAPAWEIAARRLGRGYGRLGDALRVPVIDPAVRRMCATGRPSVVDGATGPRHWLTGAAGALYKADPDTRDFSNTDRYCYDAAFDLAGIAPGHPDDAVVAALRAALPCTDEAFLLYELVHLEDPATGRPTDALACSRAVRRYLARRLPPPPAGTGPLCAFDLDGVLDSTALGFAVTTPTGVRALHALSRHGYRPVLVTGRSLVEVQERCAAHGLAGGVAEYGAVVHLAGAGTTVELLTPDDRVLLDGVREALGADPRITVHRHHTRSVRVEFAREPGSRPRPVPGAVLRDLLGPSLPDRVRLIHGESQTDIVTAATNKGAGLAALAAELGGPIDLAVGDTAEDLPMFALAGRALAPGNAATAVRDAGVDRTGRHYADGAAEAAGRVLGHRPGSCPVCRTDAPAAADARLLLALLDASAGGRPGLAAAAWRAARALGSR